jgi:hypothetical protein
MTRALVLGDTHGNWAHLDAACAVAVEHDADRIIQVGDFGFLWPTRPEPWDDLDAMLDQWGLTLAWLDGNHDWHDRIPHDADEPVAMGERVTYLPRGCRFVIDGITCVALGGAPSIDRLNRLPGRSWWPEEVVTTAQAERAIAGGHADVLFTHDAPDNPVLDAHLARFVGINPRLADASRAHREMIADVADVIRPRRHIHGHYHYPYATPRGRTMVIGLDRDGSEASARILDTVMMMTEVPV